MARIRQVLRTSMAAAALTVSALVVVPASTADASTCYQNTYRKGDRATCVKHIQTLANYDLSRLGHAKIAVDGIYGAKTKDAIAFIQRRFYPAAGPIDGIVGAKTWRLICYPQAGPGPVPGFPYSAQRAAGCP